MRKRLIAQCSIIVTLSVMLVGGVVNAGAVTQGYKTNTAIPSGAAVSLTKDSTDTVEKATQENEIALIGVAATAKDALIDLQPAGSLIRVAISGDSPLLVTDLNGDIKAGDQLIISPLAGIAMKTNSTTPVKKIIGIASSDFDKSSMGAKEVQITDASGGQKTVLVGRISVKLVLNDHTPGVNNQKQNVFSAIGQKLTGKQVTPIKLIAASAVAIGAFALSGLILNGSVKGSFISLGRNPLSKDSILGGLFRSSGLAIIIIGLGLSLAYVILLV